MTKNEYNPIMTRFLRKAIIIFLITSLVLFSVFIYIFNIYDIKSLKYLLSLCMLQHIIWLLGFLYFKDLSISALIKIYLSYIIVLFYPIICIFWNSAYPVPYLWYFVIFLGIIVFEKNHIIVWLSGISVIIISSFFLSSFFPVENFTPKLLNILSILTISALIFIVLFIGIIYRKLINYGESKQSQKLLPSQPGSDEKDIALYNAIIKCLEEDKPFKNPNLNAHRFAKALNTNVNRLSKAIGAGAGVDFHTLINNFRIDYVKSMFDAGAMNKYSIDYIFTEAGYKHRSTFNSAFKRVMEMTPSDYISQINNKDIQ